MDELSASIPQNILGPFAAIQQPGTPAKMSVEEPIHCIAPDEAAFGISPDGLRDIPLVKSPSPRQEEMTESVISPLNQNIVPSPKPISPSQPIMISAIKPDMFSEKSSVSTEHALTPVQGSSSKQEVSVPKKTQSNQEVVTATEMISLNKVLKQISPSRHVKISVEPTLPSSEQFVTPAEVTTPTQEDTFSNTQQLLLSAELATPSQEAKFLDKNTFSDNQYHSLGERLPPADEHAGIVTKGSSPFSQQAMTSMKGSFEDKMTFPTRQFVQGHLTSPCSFLSSSPILQESGSSSAFNIFGSFLEDLSTPNRLEHQNATIQNDTLEESNCLNLCSNEPMELEVATTSVGLNGQLLVNAEDQMLEQLINALGDSDEDHQSFGKDHEKERTTSGIPGRSDDLSLDISNVNPQNVCPTDQFGLLSFQDDLNSPLMNFCPGTPDTLTDPELSKNELSEAETLDVSRSEKDGVTAKCNKRKVYSKRKHDSRQPEVDGVSGVDLAKNGQSETDVRTDERPTTQQIELALGVSSGQAEGQLVSTESGSQFMVVGGQVLEILGSGGNLVQTNIEEQQNEKNEWISVDREELDNLVIDLNRKKVQTKSTIKCPKKSIRLVHDTRELRPTEGLMSRKEGEERIKNLRASREEAQFGKSSTTLNNIESSSSGCKEKVKAKTSACKTPPENLNKCWIGTKGNYIPKTPSPIKEVVHSAPYGIGRTKIDGQDKLVILKSRQPTKDSGKSNPVQDGGRFDYDLRPTEGLMAKKKDRGTINDYEQITTNKTAHYESSKTTVKSENDDLDENMSNDSCDSTGMVHSFELNEVPSFSLKTPLAEEDEIKLANTDSQNYCSSKAADRSPHRIGSASENGSHESLDSKADTPTHEIVKERLKDEASSANPASQGHWNHLSNGTSTSCSARAISSHGMQPFSINNAPPRTEMQSHKMNHHSNIYTNSRPGPQTQTNRSPINGRINGRNICEDSGGHENAQFNLNLHHGGGGLVTSTMNSDPSQMGAGFSQCMETAKQDPIPSNCPNEGSNISKHPSSQNYQPFIGHVRQSTMNYNAAVNCSSVPQQIPTYNGYASKPIPNFYGQGTPYRSLYSYPQHQGASYRTMYPYPHHQPSYFPQSYAQYYPQMYHQYLRYQSQLRYQMQLKQWYNSYYQRGAQWCNSIYQRSGQSYQNYYSNPHYKYNYPQGLMQNSQGGFNSFQGSYQNPMHQASNSSMNQQSLSGNSMHEERCNNPVIADSQVFQDESADIRGDNISLNLLPFTSEVDNGNIVTETDKDKEGCINYPEKEDNTDDLLAHQERRESEVCPERSIPYNNQEPDEDVKSDIPNDEDVKRDIPNDEDVKRDIPNVQDQTNEMANIQFIKDDNNKDLQDIKTRSIGIEIESRKRISSNLQEDFTAFSNDHSLDSSLGETSAKKHCLQIKEMELPITLNFAVEDVQTDSTEDRVANAAQVKGITRLPISPKETNGSAINEVGSVNQNDASVVNADDPFKKADASVVNEVKIFSRNYVNTVNEVAIFGETQLPPRSEVGSVVESAENSKNQEEAECFDLNGDTITNSPPGNLNNFALRRRPRSSYSKKMLDLMMREYVRSPYLTAGARSRLADQLKISEDRILTWFKNQRSKDRSLKNKVSTEGGSDKDVLGAEKRDIVNEVVCKEGIDNFGVEQLVKVDSNNANMVIHLQSDHGNQVFSINCNPVNDVENNAENEEPKDDYDDNSVEIGNNGVNVHEGNQNQTNEESKIDSNTNWMFMVSDSSGFENTNQMDQQADNILNDIDNKNREKMDDQLGMNENRCSYFEFNGDQVVDMIGDYGAKTNINENAASDLSHEQLEKLFNNTDGEGPNDDQCIGDYEFDFNFEV